MTVKQAVYAPWALVLKVMGIVMAGEILVMLLLTVVSPGLQGLDEALLDAFLLSLLLAPALYFLIVVPQQKRAALEEQMQNLLYDSLTGLPREQVFRDMVEHEINAGRRNAYPVSVIMFDPARLSEVNQVVGYDAGDAVLKQMVERIQTLCRKSDVLSRLTGDEFALLLPRTDETQAGLVAAKVHATMNEAFTVDDGVQVDINVICGTASFPKHADQAGELIRRSGMALKRAQKEHNASVVFDTGEESSVRNRFELFGKLRKALSDGDLVLHYQPQVDLNTCMPVGAESLIRWTGRFGRSPAEFIPLAEQTGLIADITAWVAGQAIRQCKQWQARGVAVPVSVNVSARNLYDDSICDLLLGHCREYDLSPSSVTVEVTESAVMDHPQVAIRTLEALRGHGFGVALDDFGTGYSSLAYLKDIPATEVKLDRSFVIGICANHSDELLVEAVIHLAKNLGIATVAEGVEDRDVASRLQQIGCDIIQGFYFSPPLPADDFIDWSLGWDAARARFAGSEDTGS